MNQTGMTANRRIAFGLLIMGLVLLAAGCEETAQQAVDDGVVRVAVDPNFPPFEFRDTVTGDVIGFDVDLVVEICDRNGWTPEIVEMPFSEILPVLAKRQVDLAASAMSITPQREAVAAFSDPYFLSWQTVSVLAGDSSIVQFEDLRGKRVGVLSGTTSEALAKTGQGLLVFPFATVERAFSALEKREIDAVINDYATSQAVVHDTTLVRLIRSLDELEFYGIAMHRDDSARLEAINQALAEMMGDGSMDSIHQHWFGEPMFDSDYTFKKALEAAQQ